MKHNALRGVNLGGWLVLERWITPSVFAGTSAKDEFSLCHELGESAREKLELHRKTFITADDFVWIAAAGLNAVRIPVGHWIFEDEEPYVGCVAQLDWAMDEAQKHGLRVLIDLHAAPGSQNGWDHSGRSGSIGWHAVQANLDRSLAVIEGLARRYGDHGALWGIELLNEPHWDVPLNVLLDYYHAGYSAVRAHCSDSMAVVMSDAFRFDPMMRLLRERSYNNVFLDTHLYQVFSQEDKLLSVAGHLDKVLGEWEGHLKPRAGNVPIIVGEWSSALDEQSLRGLDTFQRTQALRAYAATQLLAFNEAAGWFYWNLKTEKGGPWSLKSSVIDGVIAL